MMTMDVYGHLFLSGNDQEELAAAEKSLLGRLMRHKRDMVARRLGV